MTETIDYTKFFKTMMDGSMFDPQSTSQAFSKAGSYGAQFSKIAFDTISKSADLTNEWVKDSLSKMEPLTEPESEASDYFKKSTEAMTAQVQAAPEHIAKFAEVAKSAQIASLELMMSAGSEAREAASETATKVKKSVEEAA